MTQEDKELVLKDLCARLPYGVIVSLIYDDDKPDETIVRKMGIGSLHDIIFDNAKGKPYLRPMSSMTEDELIQYKYMNDALDENYEVHIDNAYSAFDWLNSHHFDYRNLIEKGLALEAPEGMYNV